MYVCMYVCMYECMYGMNVRMYVCMYVCNVQSTFQTEKQKTRKVMNCRTRLTATAQWKPLAGG